MAEQTDPVRRCSGITLHLVPEPIWLAQAESREYLPERFVAEGFIHCTDGEDLAIEVANRYYRDDASPYVVLDIDLARVTAPTIYEDEPRQYPHVYGPIERGAVTRVRRVERAPDGAFIAIGADFP